MSFESMLIFKIYSLQIQSQLKLETKDVVCACCGYSDFTKKFAE